MTIKHLIVSMIADDRPGIVKQLSDIVLNHQGNWLESSLSSLNGQFAGIVHVSVKPDNQAKLVTALEQLNENDIHVVVHEDRRLTPREEQKTKIDIQIEANDRAGIIEEIASALSSNAINVDCLETSCESASMAGYDLFHAHIEASLPENISVADVEDILNNLSDDLIAAISSAK